MSNVITLRVPQSLYERIKKLAKDDGVSLNQYAQTALAEKLGREETMQMLGGRFADLELTLKIMIMQRENDFDDTFRKAQRQLNSRIAVLEKNTYRPLRKG